MALAELVSRRLARITEKPGPRGPKAIILNPGEADEIGDILAEVGCVFTRRGYSLGERLARLFKLNNRFHPNGSRLVFDDVNEFLNQ